MSVPDNNPAWEENAKQEQYLLEANCDFHKLSLKEPKYQQKREAAVSLLLERCLLHVGLGRSYLHPLPRVAGKGNCCSADKRGQRLPH